MKLIIPYVNELSGETSLLFRTLNGAVKEVSDIRDAGVSELFGTRYRDLNVRVELDGLGSKRILINM